MGWSPPRIGALVGLCALLAGCGGSESSRTEPTDPDAVAVTSLDVGKLDCAGSVGTVLVSWETQNAATVDVTVDSGDPAVAGPSGTLTLAIPCDGAEHEVTITPLGDAGPGEPEGETVGP